MTNTQQATYKSFYKEQSIEEQKRQKTFYLTLYAFFILGFITQALFTLGVLK